MFRNYLKTTFRYLLNHGVFSAINLLGLSTAFCLVFFAWIYVDFENSYDAFNPNGDRIYRISTDINTPTGINRETSAAPLADGLKSRFPEIEEATRIFIDYYIVQKDDEPATEETLAYADPNVFRVMNFPLVAGNPATVFGAAYNMVLSESAARRYFGNSDCIGKTLTLDGHITTTITGVMKDIPHNSHFRTDMFLSMSSLIRPGTNWMSNWGGFGFSTYVLLKPHTDIEAFRSRLPAFANNHPLKNKFSYKLVAEPLQTMYLEGTFRGNKAGSTAHGKRANIYIFSAVALFVLIIACFNSINLTIALSLNRSKEIGVRKVTGATRKQLIIQFLADASALAILSFCVAWVLSAMLAPAFNNLTGKTIVTGLPVTGAYLLKFLLLALVTGLLAGIYPAFFLSSFKPSSNLKGTFTTGGKGLTLRKVLVVSQFCISILLIALTIAVYLQVHFMQNEELGFDKRHNLVIDYHYDDRITGHADAVRAQLASVPGIESVSLASCIPGRPNKTFATIIEGADSMEQEFQSDGWFVDYDFIQQYGLKLVAGRAFLKDHAGDFREAMIINEAAARKLGFSNPEQAIGKSFTQRGTHGRVIGVVKDFYFHTVHEEIQPLTLMVSPGFFTFLTLSVNTSSMASTIRQLEKKWTAMVPGLPLIYSFSDETYNAQYRAEERFGILFTSLSVMAILISCLGLLGLTFFSTRQRRKEIGVRKVLGASVSELVRLLSRDFLFLVLIAFLIVLPVSWVLMNRWLQEFVHRIHTIGWIPVAAGLLAFLIATITVSLFVVRAAMANPAKSLRTE